VTGRRTTAHSDWRQSRIRFEELSDEWKAWAAAMIQSAKVPGTRYVHMGDEDSLLYLCRVLRVFEYLCKGITENDLRGKFVSGLVCPATPDRHAWLYFDRALQSAEYRGLVTHEDPHWCEPAWGRRMGGFGCTS